MKPGFIGEPEAPVAQGPNALAQLVNVIGQVRRALPRRVPMSEVLAKLPAPAREAWLDAHPLDGERITRAIEKRKRKGELKGVERIAKDLPT